jgi:negative regulator of flagellin synthesis FlgM
MKIPGDSAVPSKINGLETKPARIAPAATVSRRGGEAAPEVAAARPEADADADVKLTGAARNLAAIEQSVRNLPAVDELRVAAVKERLKSGSYEIDPQRVADKLLRLESDLQRAEPLERSPLR